MLTRAFLKTSLSFVENSPFFRGDKLRQLADLYLEVTLGLADARFYFRHSALLDTTDRNVGLIR